MSKFTYSLPSLKPLPKLKRVQEEKILLPKGVVTQGMWDRKSFGTAFPNKSAHKAR